jgi:hypothetical protein
VPWLVIVFDAAGATADSDNNRAMRRLTLSRRSARASRPMHLFGVPL